MPRTSHLFMVRPHLSAIPRLALPAGFALRTYQRGDDIAWLHIMRTATGERWSEDAFDKCVLSDIAFREERLFFMTHDGTPVGTAGAFQKLCHGDRTGYVHMIAVLPRFQGRGLGGALLRACLGYFVRQGWRKAVLDTDSSRFSAIRLYLANGFNPFPENRAELESWREVLQLLRRDDLAANLAVPAGPGSESRPPSDRSKPPGRLPPRRRN